MSRLSKFGHTNITKPRCLHLNFHQWANCIDWISLLMINYRLDFLYQYIKWHAHFDTEEYKYYTTCCTWVFKVICLPRPRKWGCVQNGYGTLLLTWINFKPCDCPVNSGMNLLIYYYPYSNWNGSTVEFCKWVNILTPQRNGFVWSPSLTIFTEYYDWHLGIW